LGAKEQGERVITVPDDFAQAMSAAPEASAFFDKLSYTHRKKYVNWIESAKKQETRQARIEKGIAMLLNSINTLKNNNVFDEKS
jgi:uncharacterized protein YdeI (YjbR/CyaY-like superfamily)